MCIFIPSALPYSQLNLKFLVHVLIIHSLSFSLLLFICGTLNCLTHIMHRKKLKCLMYRRPLSLLHKESSDTVKMGHLLICKLDTKKDQENVSLYLWAMKSITREVHYNYSLQLFCNTYHLSRLIMSSYIAQIPPFIQSFSVADLKSDGIY